MLNRDLRLARNARQYGVLSRVHSKCQWCQVPETILPEIKVWCSLRGGWKDGLP